MLAYLLLLPISTPPRPVIPDATDLAAYPDVYPLPDPDEASAAFPSLSECDLVLDQIDLDIVLCRRQLDPDAGGPLIDPSCRPEWDARWTLLRDECQRRRDCWADLRIAQFWMFPGSSPTTRLVYSPADWACWRRIAARSLASLCGKIGPAAYHYREMPSPLRLATRP